MSPVQASGPLALRQLVRERMQKLHLTHGGLAHCIDVAPSALSKILRGKTTLHADVAIRLSQALGLEAAELMALAPKTLRFKRAGR